MTGEMSFAVPEVSSCDAPVAFLVGAQGGARVEYRLYNGTLYVLCPFGAEAAFMTQPWHRCSDGVTSSAEARDEVGSRFGRRLLIVDGVLWIQSGEPRYLVSPRGMGQNAGTYIETTAQCSSHVPLHDYYRANDWAAAQAHAVKAAENRGDTFFVERLQAAAPSIEVLIPEAVTCDLASEYEAAVRTYAANWR